MAPGQFAVGGKGESISRISHNAVSDRVCKRRALARQARNSSSSALACFKSSVPKPSVNAL